MTSRPHRLSKKKKEWWIGGFLPTDLTGLLLWLDDPAITSNITEDGSNRVSQWFDISGNGNNFPQSTGADQGLRSGSDITYDGVSEFQDGSAVVENLKTNEGEFFFVFNDLVGAGALNRVFIFATAATNNQDEFRFSIEATDDLFIQRRVGGVSTISQRPITRGIRQILNLSSNGSGYIWEQNGVDMGTPSNNNGDWTNHSLTVDTLAISAMVRAASQFSNNSFNSVIGYNRQLTATERLQVTTFLNNRFSIF